MHRPPTPAGTSSRRARRADVPATHALTADDATPGPDTTGRLDQHVLATMFASWPGAVVALDRDCRVVKTNAAADALLHNGSAELVGADVVDLVDVDDRAAVGALLDALVAGAPGARAEFRLARPDCELWVEAIATNLLHLPGFGALFVQVDDCTDRKRTEAAAVRSSVSAREADRRFRTAFETTPVGMATADIDGFYVDVNAALCELLRTTREALVGRHLCASVEPAEATAVGATLASLITRRLVGSHTRQVTYVRTDGTAVVTETAFVPIYDDGGTPLSFMVFTSDVTAHHAAVAALQRALEREHEAVETMRSLDETKAQLLAAVSHDFRTPLTAIAGFADLLTDDTGRYSDDARRDFVVRVKRNADELDRRVTEFIDVARAEHAGREAGAATALVPCDVGAVVEQVVQRCRFVLTHHTVDLSSEPAEAVTEPRAVARIVENLLGNAAKYAPAGTRVSVDVFAVGVDGVAIAVSDEGPGIPDGDREAIFRPFVRLRDGVDEPWGAGIGLPGARLLAERLGGTLRVESIDPSGSRFTLELPRHP